MKTSQILTIGAGTLVAAGVGYAIWFDHKRMNDAAFRKKLNKDKKRTTKAAKKEDAKRQKEDDEAIDAVVKEVQKPGVLPSGPQEMEK